jgi:Eukaryotic aspartyl protease
VNALYDQIPGSQDASSTLGAGFYTFPCSATIPPISFTFADSSGGTKTIGMDPLDLNFGPLSFGSDTCVGSIIAYVENAGIFNVWWLGDGYLRNTYTIFDYGQNAVGFADLV